MMRKRILIAGVMAGLLATPAQAQDEHGVADPDCSQNLKAAYSGAYYAVRHKHGARAPGRNVRRDGVRFRSAQGDRATRRAKCSELKRSLEQLRALTSPPPFGRVAAVPPAQAPSGVQTRSLSGYAIPARIVGCESGGSPTAVNGRNPNRPAGLYQIITGTWHAHGGGQFAPTADQATPEQQGIVAARIWNGGAGASQWECK